MKRFVVEQDGEVLLEATRRFVVEVPDHFTEEQTAALLEKAQASISDEEGMEWSDDLDRKWVGYDVEIGTTEVYDPDTVLGAPAAEGLKVIRLGETE